MIHKGLCPGKAVKPRTTRLPVEEHGVAISDVQPLQVVEPLRHEARNAQAQRGAAGDGQEVAHDQAHVPRLGRHAVYVQQVEVRAPAKVLQGAHVKSVQLLLE